MSSLLRAGGSSRTNGSRYPPLSARRGLPRWLQPASSTSPWLFYQVSILHQLLNVSKGDVPMALLPDPTTAASERSSVKNRLTGSRRRGSGTNRHRSRTFSKTSLRGVQAHGAGASRGGAGPELLQPAVKHEKLDKRSGAVCQA